MEENLISEVKQPKNSNFLVILLSVLLLVTVVIAGFFAYQTQKLVAELQIKKSEVRVIPIVTISPTAEPVASESAVTDTSNWKTYISPKGKFELKYPNAMEISVSASMYDSINLRTKLYSNLGIDIGIDVSDKTEAKILEDYNNGTGMDISKNKVAGQTVREYSGMGGEGGSYPYKIFILRNDNKSYTFNISNNVNSVEIDQILSTFKFIN